MQTKNPSSPTSNAHPRNHLCGHGLALAILGVLGMSWTGRVSASDITTKDDADKKTDTTIVRADNKYKVTTGTIRGVNAFNSFGQFNVSAGDVVDLHLPSGTQNLINLVWDARAEINGTVNSRLGNADGAAIGGRVFFVDPHGFVVGKTGVLNVGSLSVTTANAGFMERLMDPDDAPIDSLMTGKIAADDMDYGDDAIVKIDGSVNAQNGIRIQARAIDTSGTLYTLANGDNNKLTSAVAVNAGDLDETTLIEQDGAIVLVAKNQLTVGKDAVITSEGGPVLLAAVDRDSMDVGISTASAKVNVDGKVSGGAVSIIASASANSVWETGDTRSIHSIAQEQFQELLGVVDSPVGGTIAYMETDATAAINVGAGADINATDGDISLDANTDQRLVAVPPGGGGSKLNLGIIVGVAEAKTSVDVTGGAILKATGKLDASASNNTYAEIEAESDATEGAAVAVTTTFSKVDIDTRVNVASGAELEGGSLGVHALNTADISTTAISNADENGVVGAAAAISFQETKASAVLGADINTDGDVIVDANSLISTNKTEAIMATPRQAGNGNPPPQQQSKEDVSGSVNALAGKGVNKIDNKVATQNGGTAPSTPSAFRMGAALAYVEGSHVATAQIGQGTKINAKGDVVVHSAVEDSHIVTNATSFTVKPATASDGADVGLSAGVVITTMDHEANAEVGKNADLTGDHVGVGANVRLPRDFSALTDAVPDFSSITNLMKSLTAAKDVLTDPSDLFNSYGAARVQGDKAAIGGSVAYYASRNTSRAWVGAGAKLTATNTTLGAWTAALDDSRQATWDNALGISARNEIVALHAAGDLSLKSQRASTGQGGAAIGGSVGYIDYENSAIAGVAEGAELVSAADAGVSAINKETIISLALQSGGGGSIGVSGTLSMMELDSVTSASISNKASVDAVTLDIDANEKLFTWSGAGALAMSDTASIGASVAILQADTNSEAFVGDNSHRAGSGFVADPSLANGQIYAGQVRASAENQGDIGSIAVAGAIAKSSPPTPADQPPGFIDNLKSGANTKLQTLNTSAQSKGANPDDSNQLLSDIRNTTGLASPPPGGAASQPKFGLSVSGSASVNLIKQNTKAALESTTVTGQNGGATKIDVLAVNDTGLISISGAAAITKADAGSSKFSAAIAGAVGYNVVDNDTRAEISQSDIQNASRVAVEALSGSEQINVAMGLAINASAQQGSAGSAAGSFSLARTKADTQASIDDSTIWSVAGADDDLVQVVAYDRSHVNVGGGALYGGGRAGFGAAVTYSEIEGDTGAGIRNSTVSGFNSNTVAAYDAARIVAGAASGGYAQNGLAASIVYNEINRKTHAWLDGGSELTGAGDVAIGAMGTAPISEYEDRLSAVNQRLKVTSKAGATPAEVEADEAENAAGQIDYSGVTTNDDNMGVDSGNDPRIKRNEGGSSIIAVAGVVQVGNNSVGATFVGNRIRNEHAVSVDDSTIQASDAVTLDALDNTDIYAIAVGIGVSNGGLGGIGSVTYNDIANKNTVKLGATGSTGIESGGFAANASDDSFIGALSGAVVRGSGAAGGVAASYNVIGNETVVDANDTTLNVDGVASLAAENRAKILSGAISAANGQGVTVTGSVAVNQIGNQARTVLTGSDAQVDSLDASSKNDSSIMSLSGSVSLFGVTAGGVAVNVNTIDDTTQTRLDDVGLGVATDGTVKAAAEGAARITSLAVAGAVSQGVAVGGSSSTNFINSAVESTATGLHGLAADTDPAVADALSVTAKQNGTIASLAGAVSIGSSTAVGGALGINKIGGQTRAELSDSSLELKSKLDVVAETGTEIKTIAAAASSGAVGIAGSASTNIIDTDTQALADNVKLNTNVIDEAQANADGVKVLANASADVDIRAADNRAIASLAGAAAGGSTAGVGAAIAYNELGGMTQARLTGVDTNVYAKRLVVEAEAAGAGIKTIAAGAGIGGLAGGAASVAVNVMDGDVDAGIDGGAEVVARDSLGVLASQQQAVEVFAGSIGVGNTLGVGVGTVVNVLSGDTRASIMGADTHVTAVGLGDSKITVQSGELADSDLLDASNLENVTDFIAPNMAGKTIDVAGVAVNASNRQQVTTIGASLSATTNPISAALTAMVGITSVEGKTTAEIDSASINAYSPFTATGTDQVSRPPTNQSVDVRASHHVNVASFIAGVAGSGGAASAGAITTHLFGSDTRASVRNADVSAQDEIIIQAQSSQNAVTLTAGLAAGLSGGAGTVAINSFDAKTTAEAYGGTLQGESLEIDARNNQAGAMVAGSVSLGFGPAVAATGLVNLSSATTNATLGRAGVDTDVTAQAGQIAVTALTDTRFKSLAVSGSGAGGIGVAGMMQLHQIGNTTQARIENAETSSASMNVSAEEKLKLDAVSGALAAGGIAAGGAGATITILGSKLAAEVLDSDVSVTGAMDVQARSDRDIDMTTFTAGLGGTVGIGGSAAVLLSGLVGDGPDEAGKELDQTDKDGNKSGTLSALQSMVGAGQAKFDREVVASSSMSVGQMDALETKASRTTSGLGGREDVTLARVVGGDIKANAIDVNAESLISSVNRTGSAGVGGLGVGGAYAFTGLNGRTEASFKPVTAETNGLSVNARAGDGSSGAAADVEVYAGAAGLVGVGAAVGQARVSQTVSATVGGDISSGQNAGNVSVNAEEGLSIDLSAIGAAAGAAAAGVVVADAERTTQVNAIVQDATQLNGFSNVALSALGNGSTHAHGIAAAAGLLAAGNAVVVMAKDDSDVMARVGASSVIDTTQGGVSVQAESRNDVFADALGIGVSAGVTIGASVATAEANGSVSATVGDAANLSGAGGLDLSAKRESVGDGVKARAVAGTGGLFFSANAAVAKARNSGSVEAVTGTDVKFGAGDVSIRADHHTSQQAESLGISAGILAVGATLADAESDTTTRAFMGGASQRILQAVGNVNVVASGKDENRAKTTAGSGGLLSGNVALGRTQADATVTAGTGDNLAFVADSLNVMAEHDTGYGNDVDSVNAAALNASGAALQNRAHADVGASIGGNSVWVADGGIGVEGVNAFRSLGSTVSGAAGGVLSGNAVDLDTELSGQTRARIADGTELHSGAAPGNAGLNIGAGTKVDTDDRASLSTGGAISAAVVGADVSASFDNQVDVGNNVLLTSANGIDVGTYATGRVSGEALVNTWGVVGAAGIANTNVTTNVTEAVNIGSGTTLRGLRNIYITAGQHGLNTTGITSNSVAEGYVRGLIAVPKARATANGVTRTSANLASGSQVLGGSNVTVGAYGENMRYTASGTGRGYQLGFIPVDVSDSQAGGSHEGTVNINGEVTAGRFNELEINVDVDGKLTQTEGALVERYRITVNGAGNVTLINGQPASTHPSYQQVQSLVDGLRANGSDMVGESWILGDMFAGGGDVWLHASQIAGAGKVTANGAPSIRVTNDSNRHLVIAGDTTIPDYIGGAVRFSGQTENTGNITVTQAPSTAQSIVDIRNMWADSSTASDLITLGTISNISGLVNLTNLQGGISVGGTVYALTQEIHAPNGSVTLGNKDATFFTGGSPEALWRGWNIGDGTISAAVGADMIATWLSGKGNLTSDDPASNGYVTNWALHQRADTPWSDNPQYKPIYAGSSLMIHGGCVFHHVDVNSGGTCVQNQPAYVNGSTLYFINYDNRAYVPIVKARQLLSTASNYGQNPAVAQNAQKPSLVGRQISVVGKFVDINSRIEAGIGVEWTLNLLQSQGMTDWLAIMDRGGRRDNVVPRQYMQAIGIPSDTVVAIYDAVDKRVIIKDINASGGGRVQVDGYIVSTTDQGKIVVSSGYGHVNINSNVDRAMQLSGINVGSDSYGEVIITDRGKLVNGQPLVTTYTNDKGVTRVTDNRGTNVTNPGILKYDPAAGTYYQWVDVARIKRNSEFDWGPGPNSLWFWVDQYGNKVDPGQQWSRTSAGFMTDGNGIAPGRVFEQQVTGKFDSDLTRHYGITFSCADSSTEAACNFGVPLPPGVGWDEDQKTFWVFQRPTSGDLIRTSKVKADNSIGVSFVSHVETGQINVANTGNLYVNGNLFNPNGTTSLTARKGNIGGVGDIIYMNPSTMIHAKDLKLNAAGGIGQEMAGALKANLGSAGTLDAVAGNRGVALDLQSGAKVRVTSGDPSKGFGDIKLIANDDILSYEDGTVSLRGRDVNVSSRYGDIGADGQPLIIAAHETLGAGNQLQGGRVNANALGNINLRDIAGDFWVEHIESRSGDVKLDAPYGRLLDAGDRLASDGMSEEQVTRIRETLGLKGGNVADTIQAYERQVSTRYREYWSMLSVGTVDASGYVPDAKAIALYRASAEAAAGTTLDDAGVSAWLASRFASFDAYFAEVYGADWKTRAPFTSFDNAYSYVATAAQRNGLQQNAIWTDNQLDYAFNNNALRPTTGSVGSSEPSIIGRNVTLTARDGIGRFAADQQIQQADLLSGILTDPQVLAMALANAPGDVQVFDAAGNQLSDADLAAGAEVAYYKIRQSSPLFVKVTGNLQGATPGNAFLQATDNLQLGDASGGKLVVDGDLRLSVNGSLTGGSDTQSVLDVKGGAVLAANAAIGASMSRPLIVNVGRLDSAAAGSDLYLRQMTGDLNVGVAIANGDIGLQADGDLLATGQGDAIDGQNITLVSGGDIRHTNGSALQLHARGTGNASATAGDARLYSDGHDLHLGQVVAGGALVASAQNGNLAADSIKADSAQLNTTGALSMGDATITTGMDVIAIGAATITAGASVIAGTHDWQVASLDMQAGSTLTGDSAISLVTTAGDMTLGQVSLAGNAPGSEILLESAANILANGDAVTNVKGGSEVTAELAANGSIGTSQQPVVVDVGRLSQADAAQGSIYLDFAGDASVGTVSALAGDVMLSGNDSLTVDVVEAGVDASLAFNGALDATTLTAGNDLRTQSGGDTTLDTITAGHDAVLVSGGDLAVNEADAGHDLSAQAAGTLSMTTGTAGNQLTLDAVGDMTTGTLAAGDALTLATQGQLQAGSLTSTGGTVTADAGGNLTVDSVQAAVDVALTAGGTLDATTLTAGNDLRTQSGGDTTLDTITAGHDAALVSGGALAVNEADAGHDLSAQAAGTLSMTTGTAGNQLTLDAVGDMTTGTLTAGDALTLATQGQLQSGSLTSTGGTVTADAGGNLTVGSVQAAVDVLMTSGGDATINQIDADRDVNVDAAGTLDVNDLLVGRHLALASGDQMTLGTAVAGGNIDLLSREAGISFRHVETPATANLTAAGGSVEGGQLHAQTASVNALERIRVDSANIADHLTLAADDIAVRVVQTDAALPLTTTLTGYQDGIASKIEVSVDARDAWVIDSLKAMQAILDTQVDQVAVEQGWIGETMDLRSGSVHVWMDNQSPVLRPADVQLIQPKNGFTLTLDGNDVFTNSYVVRYGEGFRISVPNYVPEHDWTDLDYFGGSAVRYTTRMLKMLRDGMEARDERSDKDVPEELISNPDGVTHAVKVGAPD